MPVFRLKYPLLNLSIALALTPALCLADEPTQLPAVEVRAKANPDAELQLPDASSPATVYRTEAEAMKLFDSPGGTNPYTSVAEIPGVKITSADPYGLDNARGGQKGMRVRGEVSTHGVSGTLEGLSLGGPGPGPGYLFLFDKENISRIEFAQGPMSADRGGLFNTYGALNSRLRWAEKEKGAEINASFGEYDFQRYFVRADSGMLASGTSFFVSSSHTSASKWRGQGNAPDGRDNVELGVSQSLGNLHLNVIYANNEQAQNAFKALSYDQAKDLKQFRNYDFGSNPANSEYYGYNRQDFHNQALIAELVYDFSPATTLTIKPYFAKEEGYYLFAAGTGTTTVQKWLIDHETYGLSGELKTRLATTDLKLGYSWTSTAPPGPPTTRKQYSVASGQLQFQQWALLSKLVDRHEFHNTYVAAQQQIGDIVVDGSLRYVREVLPGIDAYNAGPATAGASWDVSVDDALARATKNAANSVSSRSLDAWLPQIGVSYAWTPAVEFRVNAGQTFGAPSFDAFNQSLAGSYTSKQQYWDQLRPEIATGIDLGARIRLAGAYIDPTLYYSRSRNKSVTYFNPATSSSYGQNVGKTEAMGFQLAAGWSASNSLQLVSALSYSRSVFLENIPASATSTLNVEGKQLPDVPKWMGNFGAIWRVHNVSIAPLVQYVGPRWATSNYDQRIPGYWLADLTTSYERREAWGKWFVQAGVMNLFDRRYIGQISTSEVNTAAASANTIYYPGAPRTAFASVGAKF